MSSDVKIPDAVMIEAERVNDEIFRIAHDEVHILNHTKRKEAIALALLAAEQRGRKAGLEEAADRAFQIMEGRLRQKAAYDVVGQKREARDFETMAIEGSYIAAAIRSLGENK